MARQLADIQPSAQFSGCEFDYPGVASNTPETWLETDLGAPLGLLAR